MPDSISDVFLKYESDDWDEYDEEEPDAVLDEEKGEAVHEVYLGHVHVHRVRGQEGQREAEDDAPTGALFVTAVQERE